jgi:hypothetical protein
MISLFINNKYSKCYIQLIDHRKKLLRKKLRKNNPNYEYFESHHIIPRSLGGYNNPENLVLLTPKEHYICHLLLTKMLTGNNYHKMLYAFNRITNICNYGFKQNSRIYQILRLEFSKMRSSLSKGSGNNFHGKSHAQKTKDYLATVCAHHGLDNGFFNKTHTQETKDHLSKIAKNRPIQIPPPPMLGDKNPFAKYYKITDPKGNIFVIKCLRTFVKSNDLCWYTIKIYKDAGIIPTLIYDRPYRVKNMQQKRNCQGYSVESIN